MSVMVLCAISHYAFIEYTKCLLIGAYNVIKCFIQYLGAYFYVCVL